MEYLKTAVRSISSQHSSKSQLAYDPSRLMTKQASDSCLSSEFMVEDSANPLLSSSAEDGGKRNTVIQSSVDSWSKPPLTTRYSGTQSTSHPTQLENNKEDANIDRLSRRLSTDTIFAVPQCAALKPTSKEISLKKSKKLSPNAFRWHPQMPFPEFAQDCIPSNFCCGSSGDTLTEKRKVSGSSSTPHDTTPVIFDDASVSPDIAADRQAPPTLAIVNASELDAPNQIAATALMSSFNFLSTKSSRDSGFSDDVLPSAFSQTADALEVPDFLTPPFSPSRHHAGADDFDAENEQNTTLVAAIDTDDSNAATIPSTVAEDRGSSSSMNVESLPATHISPETQHDASVSREPSTSSSVNMRRRATDLKNSSKRIHDEERKLSMQIKRSYFVKPHAKPHESLDFELLTADDLPNLRPTNTSVLIKVAEATCDMPSVPKPRYYPRYPEERARKLKKVKRWNEKKDKFEVEKITEKYYDAGKNDFQFLIKWKGYDETTWEYSKSLSCWDLVFDFEVTQYWHTQRQQFIEHQGNSIGPFLSWDAIESFGCDNEHLLVDYKVQEILASGIVPGATPYFLVKLRRLSEKEREELKREPTKPPADKQVLLVELMPKNVVMRHARTLCDVYMSKINPF